MSWKRILRVVDKIAPFIVLRIKNNTQDWLDDRVAKAIKLREKRLKQSKSTKVHIDEDLHKEAKYHAVKLIKQRKIFKKYWQIKRTLESSEVFRLTF